MTDLNTAAQAVFNAAWTCPIVLGDHPATRSRQIAAALRVAADQVVPVELHPEIYEDCCQYSDVQTRAGIRSQLLAIAAELEQ
jgi:uncharacterized protein involved in high-affinity Fe2+ transport